MPWSAPGLHLLLLTAYAAPAAPMQFACCQVMVRLPSHSPSRPSLLHTLRGGTTTQMVLFPALDRTVLQSSMQAVTELLTCCGIGVAATRCGLLTAATTRALATCVFNIFLPAMLFTSVSQTLASGASFASLLPLPLCAVLQVGLALGMVTLLLGGRKAAATPAGRDVSALAAFGNSGVLPLVFADCLFRGAPALHARANSLVALFLLGWSPLFWTVGLSILTGHTKEEEAPTEEAKAASAAVAATAAPSGYWQRLGQKVITPPIVGCICGLIVGATPILRTLLVPPPGGTALLPLPLHRCLSNFGKACKFHRLLASATRFVHPVYGPSPQQGRGLPRAATAMQLDAQPEGCAYLSLTATPPSTLMWPMFACPSSDSPAALLVLASSLAQPAGPAVDQNTAAVTAFNQASTTQGPVREVATVLLVRFLLLPLAFAGLLSGAHRFHLLQPDPLRDFILIMQSAMPSAQNTVLALQVAGEPSRAARMARRLLVIYLAAAAPIALILTNALQRTAVLAAV